VVKNEFKVIRLYIKPIPTKTRNILSAEIEKGNEPEKTYLTNFLLAKLRSENVSHSQWRHQTLPIICWKEEKRRLDDNVFFFTYVPVL